MARLTKEQIVSKINALTEKLNRLEERWERKQIKMEKEFQENLARCPYEEVYYAGGSGIVTEDMLRKHYDFDKKFELEQYEDSVQKAKDDIDELESRLNCMMVKEAEVKTYAELRKPIPELVVAVRTLVQNWIDYEKRHPECMQYYSTMSEEMLNDFVVMPIAENVTLRCYYRIGKIASFSKPTITYGKIDIYCFNAENERCHLFATIVYGHQRTNAYGTTFDVRPHIRTLTC